jgi:hypothetical protein
MIFARAMKASGCRAEKIDQLNNYYTWPGDGIYLRSSFKAKKQQASF